jgi:hypothetical protein
MKFLPSISCSGIQFLGLYLRNQLCSVGTEKRILHVTLIIIAMAFEELWIYGDPVLDFHIF